MEAYLSHRTTSIAPAFRLATSGACGENVRESFLARRFTMYIAVMIAAGWFYCAEPTEAAKKDMAALAGEWELVSEIGRAHV